MWGVIIFGGKSGPGKKIDFAKQERVFLFMVDNSIKRYSFYEGNKYPESLTDLVPKYLPLKKEDIPELDRLSYSHPKPGRLKIIITPEGIEYEPGTGGEG